MQRLDDQYPCQEFRVRNYKMQEFNKKFSTNIASLDKILGPPLLCLLPGTKFYIPCDNPWNTLEEIPNNDGVYTIIMHPEAIGLDSSSWKIYHSIKIDFIDWCKPGPIIFFPLVQHAENVILDPFKSRRIMENRGLPKHVIRSKHNIQLSHDTTALRQLKKLGLGKSTLAKYLESTIKK